jgi:hypothetical protein
VSQAKSQDGGRRKNHNHCDQETWIPSKFLGGPTRNCAKYSSWTPLQSTRRGNWTADVSWSVEIATVETVHARRIRPSDQE